MNQRDRRYAGVAEQIQARIAAGLLRPGERLPSERRLALDFSVSRAAIREAMKTLAHRRLVRIRPGRGTFVALPDVDRLGEPLSLLLHLEGASSAQLFEARVILEVAIARDAAATASSDHIEAFACRLAEMESAANVTAFIVTDTDFHLDLARATGNKLYVALVRTITDLLRESRHPAVIRRAERDAIVQEHRGVLDSVRTRDPDAAAASMQRHLEQSQGRGLIRLESLGHLSGG